MIGLSSPLISLPIQACAVTMAVVSLFPKAEPVVDVRSFQRGQTIEMEVSKPPLAALADIYYEYDPAAKVQAPILAEARPVKLRPVVLDVSDIVAEGGTRIVAHDIRFAPGYEKPANHGFSRGTAATVASPRQDEIRDLNHFVSTAVPDKAILPAPTKTLGGIYGRKAPAPQKVVKPDPVVKTFDETVQGFRDYAREITGKIEFKPGLALTSSTDQLVVYRQIRGERKDQGHVFLNRGEFAIYVTELRGDLVGELRDVQGHVLGRGMLSLEKIYTDRPQVNNLSLFLEPMRTGFGGHAYDLAALFKGGTSSSLKGARVDYLGFADFVRTMPDGTFLDVDVVEGSQTLVQISSDGYLPTIGYIQEGASQDIPLLKEEYFESLFPASALARKIALPSGYVVGRVLVDGAPKAGAQVSLLDGLKIKPVYLTDKGLPARRQNQTDGSGYFVLSEVPPGLSAVKVATGSRVESKILPVGEAAVTYIEVDMSSSLEVEVTYRSFPGDELTPMVTRTLASEDLVEPSLDVMGKISAAPGADPLFIVADGSETYEPMTFTALRESSSLELPVLKSDWVDSLYLKVGQRRIEHTGQVLGWIGARSSFVVDVDQLEDENPSAQVIYLDSRGGVMAGATEGVVGGSYILLNVGEGLRRVRVYYSSGEYSSCLAYLEAGTTAACAY